MPRWGKNPLGQILDHEMHSKRDNPSHELVETISLILFVWGLFVFLALHQPPHLTFLRSFVQRDFRLFLFSRPVDLFHLLWRQNRFGYLLWACPPPSPVLRLMIPEGCPLQDCLVLVAVFPHFLGLVAYYVPREDWLTL